MQATEQQMNNPMPSYGSSLGIQVKGNASRDFSGVGGC